MTHVSSKYALTLAVPICLGLAAALTQAIAIKRMIQPEYYLVVSQSVAAGEVLESSHLARRAVARHYVPANAVLAADLASVEGAVIGRNLRPGKLLFIDDLRLRSESMKLADDEVPIKIRLDEVSIRTNHLEVGKLVHVLLLDDRTRSGPGAVNKPIETEPLRIASIGNIVSRFDGERSDSREVQLAVKSNSKNIDILVASSQGSSDVQVVNVYSRVEEQIRRNNANR